EEKRTFLGCVAAVIPSEAELQSKLWSEQGMLDKAQKELEEAEALKKEKRRAIAKGGFSDLPISYAKLEQISSCSDGTRT
ncbi:hypothetical protein M8C21_027785, partial [Ambrosia artemisiifolia]